MQDRKGKKRKVCRLGYITNRKGEKKLRRTIMQQRQRGQSEHKLLQGRRSK